MKHKLPITIFGLLLVTAGVSLVAALLSVNPGVPRTQLGSPGSITYTASGGSFTVSAMALGTLFAGGGVGFEGPASIAISILLNPGGTVAGGDSGHDFVMRGRITAPGGGPTYDGTPPNDPLLTGEILQFGFLDNGIYASDKFDFRFKVTGGVMAPLYAGSDIGVRVTSDNGNTFAGVFTSNFGGGNPKGDLGPIPGLCGAIGDYVWNDLNGDGIQNDGATSGLNGVTVKLFNGLGQLLDTAPTGPNPIGGAPGYYRFPNRCAGEYQVQPVTPPGLLPSPTGQGSTSNDSNDPTEKFRLGSNESNPSIDFGFYSCSGKIGNLVWNDANRNGLQDIGEQGIPGVTVELWKAGGWVTSTDTGIGGIYEFSGLCGDDYEVKVVETSIPLAGYTRSPGEVLPDPGLDSNPHPAPLHLDGDFDEELSIDFGYNTACEGMIGDYVWFDENGDGIQNGSEQGIDGAKLLLYDVSHNFLASAFTNVNGSTHGYYQFDGLCAGTYAVKVDDTSVPFKKPTLPNVGSDDKDSNGSGVTVILTDISVNETIDFGYVSDCKGEIGDLVWLDQNADGIQDTGEPGLEGAKVYLKNDAGTTIGFVTTGQDGKYLFSGLCHGDYTVEVVAPGGMAASLVGGTGDQEKDSNPTPSDVVTLTLENSVDHSIDFGYYLGSLGDRVWYDTNGDGDQDTGEAGPTGWTVTISGATLPLGYVTTQTTGGNGIYTFSGLPAGSYQVCVTPMGGYIQTYDLDGSGTPHCATRSLPAGDIATDVDFGYLLGNPAITIIKKTNGYNNDEPPGINIPVGGAVAWTYDVNNTGDVTLTDVAVTDSKGVAVSCPKAILSPNETMQCTASGVAVLGRYAYIGTVVGTPPPGIAPSPATASNLDYYSGFVPTPGLKIEKTVNKPTIAPYEMVTYSYKVTNTGGTTLTNIVVTDDNGTPAFAGDDFTVGTIPSLAPGASFTFTAQVIPVVSTTSVVNGNPVNAGAVIVVVQQGNGDIKVTYLQNFGINDNLYGTGSIGWPVGKPHTFGNLTGSDKLELRFFDKNGNVVIDFYVDTITAASSVTVPGTGQVISYPSGYGTLGPFGGDGFMVAGNPNNIVTFSTSISDNLNKAANLPYKAALIVNSPTSLVGGNVVVDPLKAPGGWNHINSYTAVVKGSAFVAGGGFGGVVVPDQHNSPNKLGGPNGMSTVAKDSTVVNTAKAATAVAGGGTLTATSTASVNIVVPPQSCSLAVTVTKLYKKEFTLTIANNGPADVVLSAFNLTWPAANGKLAQINLGSNVVYTTDINAPSANLTAAQLSNGSADAKRTLPTGTSSALKMTFQNNVDKTRPYTGSFTFGGCTLTLQ